MHLSEEHPIKYEGDHLPPPIVADLNGDGKKEVLVATHDAQIQVQFFLCFNLQFAKIIGFFLFLRNFNHCKVWEMMRAFIRFWSLIVGVWMKGSAMHVCLLK